MGFGVWGLGFGGWGLGFGVWGLMELCCPASAVAGAITVSTMTKVTVTEL